MTWNMLELGPEKVYVEQSGQGQVLVCAHGLGGGAWFFGGLGKKLEAGFRTVSMDLPGTGRSWIPNSPFSLRRCADALIQILLLEKAISPGKTICVLGHSMGSIIALQVFAERPDLIDSLIFVGGLPRVTATVYERLSGRAERIRNQGMNGIGTQAAPPLFSKSFLAESPEAVAMFARLLEANEPQSYIEGIHALISADATELVADVTCPSLFLSGTEDQYATPENIRKFSALVKGNTRMRLIEDCGHMPFLERPDSFAKEISKFLDGAPIRDIPT
ncbi:MAG: alpha/beta hydrolase [Fibrobacteria bacterium]